METADAHVEGGRLPLHLVGLALGLDDELLAGGIEQVLVALDDARPGGGLWVWEWWGEWRVG
jgi:hypothetical protein